MVVKSRWTAGQIALLIVVVGAVVGLVVVVVLLLRPARTFYPVEPGAAPAVAPVAEVAAPVAVSTLAPTPTPTLARIADTLKEQLTADKVAVRSVKADAGALPTLTIVYSVDEANVTQADIGVALERSIYTISKRIATQVQAGAAIDRVVLTLMFRDTQLASTSISTRDVVAWSKGDLTDQEYQARWSSTLNPINP